MLKVTWHEQNLFLVLKTSGSRISMTKLRSCPAYMCDLIKFNADLHTRTGRYNKLNLAYLRFNREAEGGKTLSVSASRF